MHRATSLGALLAVTASISFSTSVVAQDPSHIRLRYDTFNPLVAPPKIPATLRSDHAERLFIVQFVGTPTEAGRTALAALNAVIHGYLPDDAYVVRMAPGRAEEVRAIPSVRWVDHYHAAFRLDPELIRALAAGGLETARYNMMVVDKHNDKPALGAQIRALGGRVDSEHTGSLLYSATLPPAQHEPTKSYPGLSHLSWPILSSVSYAFVSF